MPSKAKQTKVKSKGTVPGKAERQDAVEELKKLEEKGVQVVEQLRDVERQIYQLETKYLETCNPVGNALKGEKLKLLLDEHAGLCAFVVWLQPT